MKISGRQIVVIKLGGSLLTYPSVVNSLEQLLQQLDHALPLLIVGGGQAADVVRVWDRIHQLGDEAAHWLALDAIKLNEALLCQLLPNLKLVTGRNEAEAVWLQKGVPLLSVAEYLRQEEQRADAPLPHHWGVTSDTIAAWVTWHWPANCLLLVKSVAMPDVSTEQSDAVDSSFMQYAQQLPQIGWVNLRDDIMHIDELKSVSANALPGRSRME